MKKQLLSFVVLIMFVSAFVSGEKKKKTLYKRFTELFDKKVEKAEKELPPKIEKGMETFTDNLEDFENDIHAEPKKQSKFAQIFNYFVSVNSPCVHKVLTPNIIRKISFYFLRVSPPIQDKILSVKLIK